VRIKIKKSGIVFAGGKRVGYAMHDRYLCAWKFLPKDPTGHVLYSRYKDTLREKIKFLMVELKEKEYA
jgi:hypothetical protein